MDSIAGLLVQGLAMLVVLAFYLLVGGAVVALLWYAYQRMRDDAATHHPSPKPHPRTPH